MPRIATIYDICEAVVELHKKNFSYKNIANVFKISKTAVVQICQRFKDTGEIARHKNTGRKLKTSPKAQMDQIIHRISENDCYKMQCISGMSCK